MRFYFARLSSLFALTFITCLSIVQTAASEEQARVPATAASGPEMVIQYLEIVTSDVDATCETLSEVPSIEFGAPPPSFGNARIAILSNGGRLGVRAKLSEDEGAPIVRPYILVEDIELAIARAEATGAEFAMLATEMPGHGKFAIYFLGGVQYGLWER